MADTTDKTVTPARGSIPIPKSKRGLSGFLTEVRRELTKVSWPTVKETNRLTGVVLGVCGLLALLLGAMGLLFDFLISFITGGGR